MRTGIAPSRVSHLRTLVLMLLAGSLLSVALLGTGRPPIRVSNLLADTPLEIQSAAAAVTGSFTLSTAGQPPVSLGTVAVTQDLAESQVDVSRLPLTGEIALRVTRPPGSSAFIDSICLDGARPVRVEGALEVGAAAVRKLSRRDQDLLHFGNESVIVYFRPATPPARLSLVARIRPKVFPKNEFVFPLEDSGQAVTPESAFFTYRWNSDRGPFDTGWSKDLGVPFFQAFTRPTTGHPANFTYGWMANDRENLYVALEFTPDNTREGDEDYGKLYVKTPTGVRSFKISEKESTWGTIGFVYTARAAYQHHAYKFKIPVGELGMSGFEDGRPIPVAFAALGTASFINVTPNGPAAGSVAAGSSNVVLADMQLTSSTPHTLTAVSVTTSGTYLGSDLAGGNSFKLWLSSDPTLDAGDTLLDARAAVGSGGTLTFSTNYAFGPAEVEYLLVTADLAATAVAGHTIQIDPVDTSSFTFTEPGVSVSPGTPFGIQTIIALISALEIPTLGTGFLLLLGFILGLLAIRTLRG